MFAMMPEVSLSPAPIVLFVYNRSEHTRRTLDALAKNSLAEDSELWIFSDGPRTPGVEAQVEEVRTLIHSVESESWFRNVHIVEAKENLGLARAVRSGVSQVLEERGSVIVLEDDLVTAPDFLSFMNSCLDYYAENASVGAISGYCPPIQIPGDYRDDVFLVPRSCSTGWATWADCWSGVEWEMHDLDEFCFDHTRQDAFDVCGADRSPRLIRQVREGAESWSILFGYSLFRRDLLTVYPCVSRLQNIGADGSGVHAPGGRRFETKLSGRALAFTLSCPAPNAEIILEFHRLFSGTWLSILARRLRRMGLGSMLRPFRYFLEKG
jgi:hypothetical protein